MNCDIVGHWCHNCGDEESKKFTPITLGLTKREYFAAMAMQGMLAHDFDITPSQFANDAVIYADALIKELSK